MINFKQQELVEKISAAVKERFPEVEFINVTEGPEDPADLWLNVIAPENEDREMAFRDFTSELTSDILLEYGYLILVMPRSEQEAAFMNGFAS